MPTFQKFLKDYWPLAVIFLVCGLAFVMDKATGTDGFAVTDPLMMVPAEVSSAWKKLLADEADMASYGALATTLTHALLHADAEHILMNLLLIWVFGSLVYRELGAVWFFFIFIATAITGGIGQVLLEPGSPIPTLGASGALMGLEGAYLGMALRWQLPKPDVWPIAEPIAPERLMILAVVGLVIDVSGIVGQYGGIAYGAHVGGFIGGAVIATTIIPRPKISLSAC